MALVEDTDTSGVTSCFVRQNLGPWLTDPGLIDQYDAVAVARLARISRSLLGFAELLEWLQARGKSLISVAENLDFTTPHGRMMVSILIVFAAFEREQLAARPDFRR